MDSFDVIVSWYLIATLVSIAFTPLALVLFRRLTDRGASFARTISVLLFAWPAWFLSGIVPGIVPFNEMSLWATLAAGGIASWVFAIRTGAIDRRAMTHVVLGEIGFLAMFAGYVWFRGYDPTIQQQEKLSDLMMLSSTMRSESMPPNDAWLAGETINYYYAGYVPWAAIGKLVGTTPAIAYNLALASVFASTVMVAFGVAANVVGRFHSLAMARIAGALSTLFVVFMATPWSVVTAFERRDTIWDSYWFDFLWQARSQLDAGANNAITEFPSFSFQLGDLHPHLLALPFTILALGVAWMLVTLPNEDQTRSLRAQWGRIVVGGGIVGALYAMNSWDFPAYLLIAIGGLIAGTTGWVSKQRILACVALIVSSIVLWFPFYVHFESPTASANTAFADAVQEIPVIGGILASVAAWEGAATSTGDYTGLLGFAWVVGLALIGRELWTRRGLDRDPLVTKVTLGAAVAFGFIGLLLPMPLLIVAGVPCILILLLWQRDQSVSPSNVAFVLFGLGFTLTLIPEFVYLIDVFNSRMNIIFKLYYQAWVMIAIAAAIGLTVLLHAVRSIPAARVALVAVAAVMILGGGGATAIGMHQWNAWRYSDRGWIGMDGLHFLETEAGWAGEHDAIAWLYANAEAVDAMLAAGGCEWTLDVGTTASGSGVPAILGWEGHERQWHLGQAGFGEEIQQRVRDIATLWETLDPALLDEYGVTLIYIGPLETNGPVYANRESFTGTCAPGPFPNASDPDFPGAGWTEVYRNDDGTRIYRRDGT